MTARTILFAALLATAAAPALAADGEDEDGAEAVARTSSVFLASGMRTTELPAYDVARARPTTVDVKQVTTAIGFSFANLLQSSPNVLGHFAGEDIVVLLGWTLADDSKDARAGTAPSVLAESGDGGFSMVARFSFPWSTPIGSSLVASTGFGAGLDLDLGRTAANGGLEGFALGRLVWRPGGGTKVMAEYDYAVFTDEYDHEHRVLVQASLGGWSAGLQYTKGQVQGAFATNELGVRIGWMR